MAHLKPRLYWHCKTSDGWRRFPVVMTANGRIRLGVVSRNGKTETHPEGTFHLRTNDGGKTTFRNVGSLPSEALAALHRETVLRQVKHSLAGAGVQVVEPEATRTRTLDALAREFLETVSLHGGEDIIALSNVSVNGFLASAPHLVLPTHVTKNDVLRFIKEMRDRGRADSTLFHRSRRLLKFLRFAGVPDERLPHGRELPSKPKSVPDPYKDAMVAQFFAGVNPKYALWFETLLKTGLREREFMFLEPADFRLEPGKNSVTVRNKPALGFTIKDHEERTIPLDEQFAAKMRAHLDKLGRRRFVFGTSQDRPRRHIIRILKAEVFRLNLHCGLCTACVARNECEQWYLHRFRSTFASTLLRRGIDVRTVMVLMGHSNLETTLAYLGVAEEDQVQVAINNVWNSTRATVYEMPSPNVPARKMG